MTLPRSFAEAVELRARRDPDGELIRRIKEPAVSAGALLDRALAMAGRDVGTIVAVPTSKSPVVIRSGS